MATSSIFPAPIREWNFAHLGIDGRADADLILTGGRGCEQLVNTLRMEQSLFNNH